MTRNKTRVLVLAAAFALCGGVAISFAPATGAQDAPAFSSQTQKIIKTHFLVEHMLYHSLQVRSVADALDLRTFTYAPAIRDRMQNILNAGGYQRGDRVVVWYKKGDDVALKIKGKPSKTK